MSVYNHDSVKDVADSLGITNLSDDVAKTLAQDVEYRIHAIIQEASKFMRHAKRTTMRTSDISHALRVLNVEPLYGFAANNSVKYQEAPLAPGQPPLYYIEDEEVEFEKLINMPLPKVPREVTYTAHWLAIEGVQPAIPQNPPPIDTKAESTETNGAGPEVTVKPLVKHVLSKELLLYFERIGKAVLDESNDTLRTAAVASLRNDPGLHQLLPYFVQFIAEKVTHNLKSLFSLNMMLQMSSALLDNPNLFIEPYVHQMLPPILTCLIAKRLGDSDEAQDHYDLRDLAASILGIMCDRHGEAYQTLRPRLTKTLLQAYLDNKEPFTTHYGAIIGLTRMGRAVVRLLILPNASTYELLLIPALEKPDNINKSDATKCLEALREALNTVREEELPVGKPIDLSGKSETELRETLLPRIGKLLTDHVIASQDERTMKVLLSTKFSET